MKSFFVLENGEKRNNGYIAESKSYETAKPATPE